MDRLLFSLHQFALRFPTSRTSSRGAITAVGTKVSCGEDFPRSHGEFATVYCAKASDLFRKYEVRRVSWM